MYELIIIVSQWMQSGRNTMYVSTFLGLFIVCCLGFIEEPEWLKWLLVGLGILLWLLGFVLLSI